MRFSRVSLRRAGFSAAFLIAVLCSAIPIRADHPASTSSLRSLFQAFASMPGLEATFREEKQLAVLTEPIVNHGVLYFLRPGHLVRRVTRPTFSEVHVSPGKLRTKDEEGVRDVDLHSHAGARALAESMLWIVSGDQASLERSYELRYQERAKSKEWELTLKPKAAPLSQLVRQMRVRGVNKTVREVVVFETNGNRTLTRILKANPRRRYSPAERRTLFGL